MSPELFTFLKDAGAAVAVAAIFAWLILKLIKSHTEAMKQQAEDHKNDMKAMSDIHAARLREICDADLQQRREEVESRQKNTEAMTELTVAIRSLNGRSAPH